MEKDVEKIIKVLKNVHMTESERNTIRVSLLNRVQKEKPIPSPYASWWSTVIHSQRAYVLALCLVILLGSSSLIFGAQTSLPGDVLYPIKTGVNESVLRALSKTSKINEAQFEVSIMETRLSEAQELADKGDLQTQNKEQVANGIAEQTKRVEDVVSSLTVSDDDQGASTTEVTVTSTTRGQRTFVATSEPAQEASSSISTQEPQPKSFVQIQTASSTATTTVQLATTTQINDTEGKQIDAERNERKNILERVDGLLKKYRPTIQLLESDGDSTSSLKRD